MSEYYRTILVGDIPITIVSEGAGTWAMDLALDLPPDQWRPHVRTDERDRMPIGFNLALVELATARVVVDGGFGDPTPENVRMESALEVTRTPGLPGALAALGWAPERVDLVAITHAHGDHVAGTVVERDGRFEPRYPNARYLLGGADVRDRTARGMWGDLVNRWLDALATAGRLDLLEGEGEIEPGFTYVPAPGESPGHGLYRVASRGEVLYILGDLFHHPIEVTHPDWVPVRRDKAALRSSRAALAERALAEDALLLVTHLPFPGLGRLRRTGAGVEWVPAGP